MVPPSRMERMHRQDYLSLQAVNGTSIPTFGNRSLTLNLGLRRMFWWIFIIADVKKPFLGADFLRFLKKGFSVGIPRSTQHLPSVNLVWHDLKLHHGSSNIVGIEEPFRLNDFLRAYNLLVDMRHKHLSDALTQLNVQGITAHSSSPSPSLLPPYPKTGFEAISREFPAVIQPCNNNHTIKQEVTHHITTTGPPVYSRARRLSRERLKIARQEFEHMLDLGIIHPSASSWSSPKKTPSDWRPCGDY